MAGVRAVPSSGGPASRRDPVSALHPGRDGTAGRFLAGRPWPFHSGPSTGTGSGSGSGPGPGPVRAGVAGGYYDSASARACWILAGDERVGLIRHFDLGDPTPIFDLRIRAADRARGIGGQALGWLTGQLLALAPGAARRCPVRDHGGSGTSWDAGSSVITGG